MNTLSSSSSLPQPPSDAFLTLYGNLTDKPSILFVGEGDFSYPKLVATNFSKGAKLDACALETEAELLGKYPQVAENIQDFLKFGGKVFYEVDAKKLDRQPFVLSKKYDRIIFNVPLAGEIDNGAALWKEKNMGLNKKLYKEFFDSAYRILKPLGEIHILQQTSQPYDKMDMDKAATSIGLEEIASVDFKVNDFPHYHRKKGCGEKPNNELKLKKPVFHRFRKINQPRR